MKIDRHLLHGNLSPGQAKDGARIVNLKWYTGAVVNRYSWDDGRFLLALSMKPAHVRMERLRSGKAPLLNSHSDYRLSDVIGVIEHATLKGDARIRLSNRPEVDPIWVDIQDGIIRNASVGTQIYKLQETTKEGDELKSFLAVDWEPTEVSLVPIGADMNAGFGFDDKLDLTGVEIVNSRSPRAQGLALEEVEREKLRIFNM